MPRPDPDAAPSSSSPPPPAPGPAPTRPRPWLAAMAAAAIAGGLAWGLGESSLAAPPAAQGEVNFFGSGVMVPTVTFEAQQAAARRTAAGRLAALGGAVGLMLGLAGGLAASARGRAARAGAAGLLAGGVLGGALGWFAEPAFDDWRARSPESLAPALAQHAVTWVPLGALGGACLALGAGAGRRGVPAAALAGALGAALATAGHEVIAAVLFPLGGGGAGARLIAALLVPLGTAAAAARALAPAAAGDRPAGGVPGRT